MSAPKRRTQAERRESTIAKLLDATIAELGERGYSQLTVASVCKRAGLSQGALFRHFANRNELVAGATEEVCRRHLTLLGTHIADLKLTGGEESIRALIKSLRAAARSPVHAAWHEVMVAARTSPPLHELVAPTLIGFESALLAGVNNLAPTPRLGIVMLSVLHLLDSEAVTVAVYPNPELEAAREDWLVELLAHELSIAL